VSPDGPFPSAEARRYLLGIHALRYVVVHNGLLDPAEQRKWRKLERMPWARLVGHYGDDDLYRLTGDMRGRVLAKYFSRDYARAKTRMTMEVRAFGPGAPRQWVDLDLNGQPLGQQELGSGWTSVSLPLSVRRFHSVPNVVTLRFRYEGRDVARPIGKTGAVSPVDLGVVSGGRGWGDVASVTVNGQERASNRRGYNVVAMDGASGDLLWSDLFDTFAMSGESRRLAHAIAGLPPGTIVAAAVKDEASLSLTDEGVAALRWLGGREDIRGRFRVSHLLVGIAGASPGTAIERVGQARLAVTLGVDPAELGVEVRNFAVQ
jgi:hypothetical protein